MNTELEGLNFHIPENVQVFKNNSKGIRKAQSVSGMRKFDSV